jgi:hypothetical protein
MVLGMATGSMMISGMGDHYFGELKALIGSNKSSCRGFFCWASYYFLWLGNKIILSGTRDSLKIDTFHLGGGALLGVFQFEKRASLKAVIHKCKIEENSLALAVKGCQMPAL